MLDHKNYKDKSNLDVANELDHLCEELDQKHRQQRKVQFLLDVRGYFIINKIKGNYLEFGIYRGEMMYCAWRILKETGCIKKYIGLDTFCGTPLIKASERKVNKSIVNGSYKSGFQQTNEFLRRFIKNKLKLIPGDFRKKIIIERAKDSKNKIALAVIDCNLMSSIEKSLKFVVPNMVRGGILFVDDFFINMHVGNCPILSLMKTLERENNCKIIEFKTYAPFARAFIVISPS